MRTARSLPYGGVPVQGGLCPGGVFVQGGSLSRGGLCQGNPLPPCEQTNTCSNIALP